MSRDNGKKSVAVIWGEMVADAVNGEVVAIADKFGKDVAIMISLEGWRQMNWDLLSLSNVDMLIDMPDSYEVGMTWEQVTLE